MVNACSHFTQLVSRRPFVESGSSCTWVATGNPFVLRVNTIVFG